MRSPVAAAVVVGLALAGPALGQVRPLAGAPQTAPAAFDATDPNSLVSLLADMGAKAAIAERVDDAAFLQVTTPAYGFSAQYAGCDARGRACKALAFSSRSDARAPSLAQLNAFTQTSLNCRVWQDPAGKAHVGYTALVSQGDSREEMRTHLGAWQGCLAEFGAFLKDPVAYLAEAP